MTAGTDPHIDSQESFLSALESVLMEAHQNDVDVEGGWLLRTDGGDESNWDVEIWPVESRDSPE